MSTKDTRKTAHKKRDSYKEDDKCRQRQHEEADGDEEKDPYYWLTIDEGEPASCQCNGTKVLELCVLPMLVCALLGLFALIMLILFEIVPDHLYSTVTIAGFVFGMLFLTSIMWCKMRNQEHELSMRKLQALRIKNIADV